MIGTVVSFWDFDDATGEEIKITGIIESTFTDPEDVAESAHVRDRHGKVWTPYVHECQPVRKVA